MKLYQSHKKVRAFKLVSVVGLRLNGEDPLDFVDVSPVFIVQHNLNIKAGCYVVVYNDDYVSVSPIKAFESGYSEIEEDVESQDDTDNTEKEPSLKDVLGNLKSLPADYERQRQLLIQLDEEDLAEFFESLDDGEYQILQINGVIDESHNLSRVEIT